jgi:inosine-uridine nucleoside N-ribohydrolase
MAEAIGSSFEATGEQAHLVCTGALTNAALLVTLFPEAMSQCSVTIMGGALGVGNTGPVQEFNIMVRKQSQSIAQRLTELDLGSSTE